MQNTQPRYARHRRLARERVMVLINMTAAEETERRAQRDYDDAVVWLNQAEDAVNKARERLDSLREHNDKLRAYVRNSR